MAILKLFELKKSIQATLSNSNFWFKDHPRSGLLHKNQKQVWAGGTMVVQMRSNDEAIVVHLWCIEWYIGGAMVVHVGAF